MAHIQLLDYVFFSIIRQLKGLARSQLPLCPEQNRKSRHANLPSWEYSISMSTSLSENSMRSSYLLRAEGASQLADSKKWMLGNGHGVTGPSQTSWQKHIPTSIVN